MKPIQLNQSIISFGEIPKITLKGSALLISDECVASLYLQDFLSFLEAKEVFTLILPSGESEKNLKTLEKILDFALECGLDRQSTFLALGGGVISDLVGLASGLFMRGVDFYNIPTTLLAQVDASVGGKCGINSPKGKNLIGLFHQPSKVFISPSFLKTLPQREFNAGMAEVIKMAVCFSPSLFHRLFDTQWVRANLLEVIFQSISIKARIVLEDEKEKGLRSALNYGHTFGHAIEKEGGFEEYLHGEAVAMGMVMANALALKITNFQDSKLIATLLERYDLPTTYKIKNKDLFFQSLFLDKKTQNKQIKFILPKTIGSFDFYFPSKDEIEKILSEFL